MSSDSELSQIAARHAQDEQQRDPMSDTWGARHYNAHADRGTLLALVRSLQEERDEARRLMRVTQEESNDAVLESDELLVDAQTRVEAAEAQVAALQQEISRLTGIPPPCGCKLFETCEKCAPSARVR